MDQNLKRHQTSEACSNMIVNIRQLRLSVLDLFNTLADGGVSPDRLEHIQQGTNNPHHTSNNHLSHHNHSHHHPHHHHHHQYHQYPYANQSHNDSENSPSMESSHVLCSSSVSSPAVQRQLEQRQQTDLIQYVNQMISSIGGTIRNLDHDVTTLINNKALMNTGESVHLGLDGSLEKHNLYMDLCLTYKNYAKLHDYSMSCFALLHQQSLKRVHNTINPNLRAQQNQQQQQQRSSESSIVATFNPYMYNKSLGFSRVDVKTSLEGCLRKCEFMNGVYSQPFGVSTGVFQISVKKVLKAVLLMRGIVIDAVIVKSYHESFAVNKPVGIDPEESASNLSPFVDTSKDAIDLWSESKYNVFRKLTHHANAAVLHFQYPTFPEIAVKSFLSWFNSYADLFEATCSRCNMRLKKFMPPICRDFSSGFHPYHDSCK